MTIFQGSEGSLTIYFKDIMIGTYPLTKKKTYERYKYQGVELLLQTMKRTKITIKEQIYRYLLVCNGMIREIKQGKNIWRSDRELVLSCIFALIKLKILDEDECVLIMPRKRLSRHSSTEESRGLPN